MKVRINANICDSSTTKLAAELRETFAKIENKLSGNYGGVIEHLWIDIELSEMRVVVFGKPPKPFRFQKKVSGSSRMGLPAIPDSFNVGHYSIRPDFEVLKQNTIEQNVHYIVGLVYNSTEVLLAKQKKLGGFDAIGFRNNFFSVCTSTGFTINQELP
jgi:hypothetical protein